MATSRTLRGALPFLLLSVIGCASKTRDYSGDGTGGDESNGGDSSTGGQSATGGKSSTGGRSSTGGKSSSSEGGASTGGTSASTGGMSSEGGASNSGGTSASTGGTSASTGGTSAIVCGAGTQDNDNNGTCTPTCVTAVLNCGSHAKCADASGTARCECAVGYIDAAGSCVWGSVPLDPGFLNVPVGAWTLASGASITPTSVGLIDDGNVVFDRTTICTGNGSATQTVTLPPYALAEPMQLELSSQGACTGTMSCSLGKVNVFFNGAAMGFTLPTNYSNQTRCLGERAFGATAPMIVRHGARGSVCDSSVSLYTASVDHLQIKTNSACPKPRSVANADFEGTTNFSGTGSGATSAFTAGVGVGASQAWRMQMSAGACSNANMRGEYSFPYADGAALSISLNGTAGKNLAFGEPDGATWGEYIAPSTTYTAQTLCLPQYAKGMVMPLQFRTSNLPNGGTCSAGDARTFHLDNNSLTTSSSCPADSSIVDGGFELSNGVINYWATSLNLNGVAGSVSAAIVTGAANAHGGSRALVLTTQQSCTSATAMSVVSVPAPGVGAGPALKFYFKGGSTNGSTQVTVGSASMNVPSQSAYVEQTLCLDPASAGTGASLMVRLLGNGGTCANTFALTTAYLDDFRVTTDAACPTK